MPSKRVKQSTHAIQAPLQALYGVAVSHTLSSNVTEAVALLRQLWQNRSLAPVYPMVYVDAIGVKVRQEGRVRNALSYVSYPDRKAVASDLRAV